MRLCIHQSRLTCVKKERKKERMEERKKEKRPKLIDLNIRYEVATISRLLKIIDLCCKRAL